MKFSLLSVGILLSLTSLAQAGPLDLRQISADAKWVAHIDLDALRDSTVVHTAHRLTGPSRRETRDVLFGIARLFGADPRQQIHGITLYGSMLGKPEGVMIVHSDFNRDLVEQALRLAPEYQCGEHNSYRLHTWKPRLLSKKGLKGRISAAFFQRTLLVIAGSECELKRGLDVLNGKTPGLTEDNPGVLSQAVRAGTVFLLRAIGDAEPSLATILGFLKETDSISVALGEYQEEVFKECRLVMRSPEAAKRVVAAAEGAQAIAELRLSSDPEAMKLVHALQSTIDNTGVTLAVDVPAEVACHQVEKLWAQIAQRRDVILRRGL
jgi:hypothetical protein